MLTRLLLLASLLMTATAFDFRELQTTASVTTINKISNYTFIYDRKVNNDFYQTSYSQEAVPSDANITVTFPSQYLSIGSAQCLSLSVNGIVNTAYNCSITGNTITFINTMTTVSNLYVTGAIAVITNVLNPVPAITTSGFTGTIGNDVAVSLNTGLALTAGQFTSYSLTFSPNTDYTTSTMIITITPTNALSSGSFLKVQFPGSIWTNDVTSKALPITASMVCTNYSANVNSVINCQGSGGTLITVTSLFSSSVSSSFAFGVTNFLSPPSLKPSDYISVTSYVTIAGSNYKVDTCSMYPSGLVPKPFNSLVVAPTTTMTVNSLVALRFTANFSAPINQRDYFKIVVPTQMSFTFNNVYGAILSPQTTITGQNITIVDTTTTTFIRQQNFSYVLTAQNFKAPPSTAITTSMTFEVVRDGFTIMTGTTTFTASPGTLIASATPSNTKVLQTTSYVFSITTTNPISSSGTIKITLPTQVTVNNSTATCQSLSGTGTGTTSTPACSFPSTSTILVSALNSSSNSIGAQTLTLTVTGLTNPSDTSQSGSFTITTYYTSASTGQTDTGIAAGVTATMGTINIFTVSIAASSYVVYQTGVTYTFTFNNTYPIPVGGKISIEVPTAIAINTLNLATYSKYSLNNGGNIGTAATYAIIGDHYQINFTNVAPTTAIPANTLIKLELTALCTNPSSTRIISPFTITTWSTSSPIENVTGMAIQMTTPADFTAVDVNRTSNVNSDKTTYTFKLRQQADLPAGSLLVIGFPNDIAMTITSTCTDLAGTALNCTQTSYQGLIVTLPTVASGVQFGVIVSNVVNPPSTRPSTTNFQFQTKTSDQLSTYASRSITNPLTVSLPSAFANLTYSFSPAAYSTPESLSITLTPLGYVNPTSFIVELAPSFTVTALACNSFVGFIGSCSISSQSAYGVNVTGMTGASQVSFTVTGFTSGSSTPSDFTTVSSFEGGFLVSQNTGQILFTIKCALPCKTCTANTSACLSCYDNTAIATQKYYLASTYQCYDNCPNGYYQSALTCALCSTTCLTCDVASTNCTTCNTTSSYPAYFLSGSAGSCLASCPTYYYLSNSTTPQQCVLCDNTTYHCLTCTALSSCSSCQVNYYLSSGTCTSTCPSGTTIPNSASWVCQPCSVECATCSNTTTNCTSCSSTSVQINGQCLAQCPYPLVKEAGACVSCDSSCKTCSGIKTNCTACYTNTSLPFLTVTDTYLGSCVSTCTNQSEYGDLVNGVCASCAALPINCDYCFSQTSCHKCKTGYVLYQNSCLTAAPPGYYDNNGVATLCSSICATCSLLANNCTSCIGALALNNNSCTSTCDFGEVPVNNVCVNCSTGAPNYCRTCQGTTTYCTACVVVSPQVYLFSGSCGSSCPNYTYPDSDTLTCQLCTTQSHCEMCSTNVSCITCITGYYLYNSTCATTCPNSQYVPLNRLCQPCTAPCLTCSGSQTYCTTCVTNTFLYLSTCANPCPSPLFMNNATGTCTGCSTDCATCGTYSSQCLSCPSGKYLQGISCVSACSLGYYPLGTLCQLCPSSCSACTSNLTCSACSANYYLYLSACLSACPATRPIVNINGVCSTCSNLYCVSCNSSDYCSSCFFPQLLVQGTCVTSCPTDYVVDSTGTACLYSPTSTNTTNTTTINSTTTTLTESLTTASTFPVPFTVAASFIGVACLMSKFQHERTHLSGSLYALWGLLEWAALGFLLFYYKLLGQNTMKLSYWLALGGMAGTYLLNLVFLLVQNISLRKDKRLQSWLCGTFNACWYYSLSFLGLVTTNKVKNLLFTKLFAFSIFSARLESTHQLRSFNAYGFFAFVPALAAIAGTAMLLYETTAAYDQLFMAEIDVLLLAIAGLVLALCHIRKDEDFFEDTDEDGLHINKRVNALDQILNAEVMPEYGQLSQKSYQERHQSARKFNNSTYSVGDGALSEVGSLKSLRDMSIQADQLLGERSFISRLGTERISDLSLEMFHKNDVSMQFDEKREMVDMSVGQNVFMQDVSISPPSVHQHDVSIEAQQPVLMDVSVEQTAKEQGDVSVQYSKENKEISVQYSQENKEISVQYSQEEQAEVSIQHVPIYTDGEVHMTKEEEEIAIQCEASNQSQSVQYSAKPVIEQIEDDLLSESIAFEVSKDEEPSDLELQRKMLQGEVAPMEEGLKPELELDIEEKLEKKRAELAKMQQERIEREKEEARRLFQERVEQKEEMTFKEAPAGEEEHLANIFNNTAEAPSSLLEPQEVIEIHLPPRPPRPQTAKTEQEFINMLSGSKSNHSQNVSKDSGLRSRAQVESRDSFFEDHEHLEDEGEEEYQPELAQQSIEQFPSAEKSRSTANMTGRIGGGQGPVGRGGPILDDSDLNSRDFSKKDETINEHPLQPEHQKPYRQEEIDLAQRTKLTELLDKRTKRNVQSSTVARKIPIQEEEDALEKELQQRPLAPQKSEQMIPKQESGRKRSFKVQSLEFDNNDHVFIPSEADLQDALEQQTKKSLSKKPSLKRIPSRDKLIEGGKGSSNTRGYLRQTFTSEEKRRSLEKIYLNKMKK